MDYMPYQIHSERFYHYVYQYQLVAQSRPTLCDPTDYSPPGSSVCGTFQARALE